MAGTTVRRCFHGFLRRKNMKKKVFFSCPASSGDLHPKRSPYSRIFVTGGSVIAWQMLSKKKYYSWGGQLVSYTIWIYTVFFMCKLALPRNKLFICPPAFFRNLTDVFCAKKQMGHACIMCMPQNGCCILLLDYYCLLASQFWRYTLPQIVGSSAAKKWHFTNGCAPTIEKKSGPFFFSSLAVFVAENSVTLRYLDSREKRAILV